MNEKNEKLSKQVEKQLEPTIQNKESVQLRESKLHKLTTSIEMQSQACEKEHKFFKDNDECPTCSQEIDLKLKQEKIETTKKRLEELDEGITKGNDELANLNATIEIFNKTIADCREWNAEISGNTKTIGKLNKIIDGLQSEIENQIESSGDLSDANAELEEMRKKKEKLQDTKYKLNEQFSYHQVSSELLRDSGIKSKIIKQYLPLSLIHI